MFLQNLLVRSFITIVAATTVPQALAAQKVSIPQTRSSKNALEEIAQVRMLARAASLCKWDDREAAMSTANFFSPILIGLSTKSFEAYKEFVKGNGKLAADEIMGEAPPILNSICREENQKAKWTVFKQAYDYDKAVAAAGTAIYSDEICAYQPLKANKLTAAEAQNYLILGANKCNAQVVEKAIALGANPNQPGNGLPTEDRILEGKFALATVLEQGEHQKGSECTQTIKTLLGKGAKANQSFDDVDALHIAVQASAELIDILINAGANPNAAARGEAPKISLEEYGSASRVSVGQTPLMYFVKERSFKIEHPSGKNDPDAEDGMRVLNIYLKKSNLDARDWLGRTALILAIEQDMNKTARALLTAGADKSIKDQFGRNALAYAKLAKNKEMVKLLAK